MARAAPIDKDDLRHDAIQDWMFAAIGYVHQRRTVFSVLGGALLLVVVGVFGYVAYARALSAEAAEVFNAAESLYRDTAQPADRRLPAAAEAFQAFVGEYPGSALAPYGWMYVASIALEREQPEAAAEAYGAVIDSSRAGDGLRGMARIGLAKLKENSGELDESNRLYRGIQGETYADAAELGLGRVALAGDDAETARAHLEALTQDHPDSPLAPQAQQALFFLK